MDYPSIDIDETTERERREVSAMFEEDVELAPDHFERDYCVFKVKSVNGIEPSKTVHVLFCNDRPYLIPEGGDEDYKGGCLLCKVFLDSRDSALAVSISCLDPMPHVIAAAAWSGTRCPCSIWSRGPSCAAIRMAFIMTIPYNRSTRRTTSPMRSFRASARLSAHYQQARPRTTST